MAAKAGKKRKTAPGIHERTSEAGRTFWQVKLRTKGFPAFVKSFDTYAEAELELARVRLQQRQGIRIDHRKAEQTTLGDVLVSRISALEDKRRAVKGAQSELYRLNRFLRIETTLCAYAMANLTPAQFEDWTAERLEDVAPGTLKRELTLLRPILKEACRTLGLATSPLDAIPNPRVSDERIARFEPGEEDRLMGELARCTNRLVRICAEFALETGVRRSELLALEWRHYDSRRGTIFLPDSKNGRGRSIPLTRHAQALVETARQTTNGTRVFATSMETLKQAFERARERAGMTHWRWHDFRHEAISRLFDAGWTAEQVMDVSGHRDIKSLLRYRHVHEDETVARLRRLEETRASPRRVGEADLLPVFRPLVS